MKRIISMKRRGTRIFGYTYDVKTSDGKEFTIDQFPKREGRGYWINKKYSNDLLTKTRTLRGAKKFIMEYER